jgi:hypothetical protein
MLRGRPVSAADRGIADQILASHSGVRGKLWLPGLLVVVFVAVPAARLAWAAHQQATIHVHWIGVIFAVLAVLACCWWTFTIIRLRRFRLRDAPTGPDEP